MESSSQEPAIVGRPSYAFWLLAGCLLMMFLGASAQDLPAGTALEARLSVTTGSRISHRGDPIEATIIAPVSVGGRILVPQGSRLLGSVTNVTALGRGLKHSTASVTYGFQTLVLPDGTAIPLSARLVEIDTAKERVDDLGTVTGIPPIASLSSAVSFFVVPLLLVNPPIGVPIWGMKSVIAPSANPEIRFPTGTELILRLSATVTLPATTTAFRAPTRSLSPRDLTEVEQLLKNSAQRAHMGGRPSDMVNVLLMGSRSQLDRVFLCLGMGAGPPEVADSAVSHVPRPRQTDWLSESSHERANAQPSAFRIYATEEPEHGPEAPPRASLAVPGEGGHLARRRGGGYWI